MSDPVRASKPHDEIVRMLVVDERRAAVALAGLKYLRRADRMHGERLERQHPVERDMADVAPRALRDITIAGDHEPVLGFPRREVGEFSLLVVEAGEDFAVLHPHPARLLRGGRGCCRGGGQGEYGDSEQTADHVIDIIASRSATLAARICPAAADSPRSSLSAGWCASSCLLPRRCPRSFRATTSARARAERSVPSVQCIIMRALRRRIRRGQS